MRIESLIGVILGIGILVIICVFLNTRTNFKEPKLSTLVLPTGGTQHHEIEEIKLEVTPEKRLVNSRIIEKSQIAEEILFEEEEETLPEDVQQVASVDISTKTMHKVKPNDSLVKISKEYFGDETKWYKIFEANKDNMSDPNSLYVGQELLIPDVIVEKAETQTFRPSVDKKPEHNTAVNTITHTVQSGDSLYRIAGKYYDDPAMWEKIYKANEETIEDTSLLRKGQILVIP